MDAADAGFDVKPDLPVAISLVGSRYLLFDVQTAAYVRREHGICGTTIGTLPLSPAQNLFLGVPVEIMPEEAQLLVEIGVGFVVDDARAHDPATRATDAARRADYLARTQRQARQIEQLKAQEKQQARKRILDKQSKIGADASTRPETESVTDLLDFNDGENAANAGADSLAHDGSRKMLTPTMSNGYHITPTTSRSLLDPSASTAESIHHLPSSYPLYKHLHDRGFFMTPGLRFGCQYTVYPGDPLRFHSHFLAVGTQWDDEMDLMDIVGGGRLGTGVKKGFLLGGASPLGDVRTFSVEWAAM